MKFSYLPAMTVTPDTGEATLILRPLIPLRIYGPKGDAVYSALVDSGADNTIIPDHIAAELGIVTPPGLGPAATAFGGQTIPMSFADVTLQIGDDENAVRWLARVLVYATSSSDQEQMLILGHVGCLDYFVTTFDGFHCELTLNPTDDLPKS